MDRPAVGGGLCAHSDQAFSNLRDLAPFLPGSPKAACSRSGSPALSGEKKISGAVLSVGAHGSFQACARIPCGRAVRAMDFLELGGLRVE